MNDPNQPGPTPQRATQSLDPDSVDTETPDVNRPAEGCQVVEATTRDGQPITFAVHTLAPLSEPEQAMLGVIAQAAAERMAAENAHGGVLTELMLAAVHAQVVLRDAGKAQRADRLSAAVRAAADVIRARADDRQELWARNNDYRLELAELDARLAAERSSRFRWAEEAAEADLRAVSEQARANVLAWLHAEAVWHRDRLDDEALKWTETAGRHAEEVERLETELAELRARAEAAIDLIDEYDGPYGSFEDHPKWAAVRDVLRGNPEPATWSCKCGMDVTDMVHTAERCYSTVKPVSEVDGVS